MRTKGGRKRRGSPLLRQRDGEEAGPVRGQGEPAALPQDNGEEAAPVRGQGEVAAPERRARFAAVIEMLRHFWARLRRIGQMHVWRRSVSGEAAEVPPAVRPRRQHQAWLHKLFKKVDELPVEVDELPPLEVPRGRPRRRRYRRPRRRQNQAEMSPEPEKKLSRPLLMVDDLPVSEEQKLQYMKYCRARAGYPENVTFCHLCFFHKVKYDGGKFPNSKSFLHYIKHEGDQLLCPRMDCLVRVSTVRERQLHNHFCHIKPAGWWNC